MVDVEGSYRLLYCASKGNKDGVLQEIEKGVSPNLADYDKRTALHLASCEGWTEIASLLVEKGADVNPVDRWGRTPLSDAHSSGHEEICKILEAQGGIDPAHQILSVALGSSVGDLVGRMQQQMVDLEGPYRLLYFSSKGDMDGVLHEIEKGVSPNLANYDKRTALHLASCEGGTDIAALLLEKGADVNSVDRWGRTPLSDARKFGYQQICKILEAWGGVDTVELDSQNPSYEIDACEVDMDGATLIGEGVFGENYLVRWRGTEVAAKTIPSCIASIHRVRTTFMNELALWQSLRHPNIVQFLGVLKHSDRLMFLTEYLRNGSLYDILNKKGQLAPATAMAYALDIARGINYLHQHKPHPIMHRNLTPRNVLQDDAGHLKITDFGLSKIDQRKDSLVYKMSGGTGSYRYMAPEVYRREAYGKSVDVFSFAVIVHEMFQGRPSNRAEAPEEVARRRAYEDSRPSLSSCLYPEEVKRLLRQCWQANAGCRPSFEEIITDLEMIQETMQKKKSRCSLM